MDDVDHPDDLPTCPIGVPRASMVQRWDDLTFLHWSYPPDVVQRHLPDGLTVETHGGRAWVALVPFRMEVRLARGPALPWVSRFAETNVRTYVTATDGTRGVWFFSLDASRLAAVVTARVVHRLPYFWSAMRVRRDGDLITYTCERRWPGPKGATSRVTVEVGDPYEPEALTGFDHYLTARWRLYRDHPRGMQATLAEHAPWPLHRAEVVDLDDALVTAAGLPAPVGSPLVHWSPGVEVRIGSSAPVDAR